MMNLTEAREYLNSLANNLCEAKKINIELNRKWSNNFPNEAGVYIFIEEDKIVYVGETISIKKRMKNVLDTRHHTIRRKIGQFNFSNKTGYVKASSKLKFNSAIEKEVDNWMTDKMKFSFLQINLGRKELEDYISNMHKPKYNSVYLRGRK